MTLKRFVMNICPKLLQVKWETNFKEMFTPENYKQLLYKKSMGDGQDFTMVKCDNCNNFIIAVRPNEKKQVILDHLQSLGFTIKNVEDTDMFEVSLH